MNGLTKVAVLDVLKSQSPGIEEYGKEISQIEGVDTVNITVIEIDAKTETLKVSLQGENIKLDEIRKKIKELGGSIHSVDKIIASKKNLKDAIFHDS
ncbi:MAG: DUF211 domain-containing protein [Candidatus Omnitrophica bacterium]|nr:DUF211 domain-containing protein [Candidatus Omnitrophota bacterium]MCF7877350.1 DUF211 domain-containing protein [Candidatus Omnitrophota bacterium]MCF7892454.1 DUF211 domain-containing protein [Candidatus Omnitrophota bacterium]MCF7895453.1 DUF211 domain-containing protein [Candidatus Omnitrophota bacterium]MCF7897833.1 DUF211 domain-containing protein [Candidatus Omnitrophota bacterium]